MKKIVIKDLMFYILNLKKDVEKRRFMQEQMEALGLRYSFIDAVQVNPGFVGIALSHLKALRHAKEQVPFAILEDDAQLFGEAFQEELLVPEETDGIYLGHSTYGVKKIDRYGLQWGKQNGAEYEIYNADFLRIHSMLARHAIIYVSEQFKENAILANKKALYHLQFPHPGDMAYAQIQRDHLLLSPNQPWCYQSEKHRGNHVVTKSSLLEQLPLTAQQQKVSETDKSNSL